MRDGWERLVLPKPHLPMSRILSLILLLSSYQGLVAQSSLLTKGNQELAAREWSAANETFAQYLRENPDDANARLSLGITQYQLRKFAVAEQTFDAAEQAGVPALRLAFHRAKSAALQGQAARAIETLEAAVEQGLAAWQQLNTDPDFASLRKHAEFSAVVLRAAENATPCCQDDRYRKLDFWLGEWEVYVGDQMTAVSSITKGEGDCTLHENYRTRGGYTGRSFNYFDPQDSLYKQIWVDRNNVVSTYRELEARPGYLLLETYGAGPMIRMAYSYDREEDSITQTLEQSQDGGEHWQNVFTGVYRRRAGTQASKVEWLSAEELLKRSRALHDPQRNWARFQDTIRAREPRLRNQSRATLAVLDRVNDHFVFERAYGEDIVRYEFARDACTYAVNGQTELTEEQIKRHRLSCERGSNYRRYYEFLYGLPMELDNYGWESNGIPQRVRFKGEEYWQLELRIEGAPFSEDWTLYFDPENYMLRALVYRPPNPEHGSGEYLLLDGTMEKQGVRLRRTMTWYSQDTDEFLGMDIGF